MVGFIRATFMKIKKVGMAVSCMGMATCTLVTSPRIKNMARGPYTGLVFAHQPAPKTPVPKFNNTMEIGGEAYPMVKANIRKPTETSTWEVLRMD